MWITIDKVQEMFRLYDLPRVRKILTKYRVGQSKIKGRKHYLESKVEFVAGLLGVPLGENEETNDSIEAVVTENCRNCLWGELDTWDPYVVFCGRNVEGAEHGFKCGLYRRDDIGG